MLSVRNLRKVYKSGKAEDVVALDGVSIDFPETGFVFLLGKSGSGKSTLLNAIGGLDKFDGGEIIIKGKSSADFSQSDFDSYRNTFIGFIFQEYNILENFTVAKNLALALELQGKKADHREVMRLLEQVEMQDYAKRKPNQLSGGQKQRVAIARALIKNPEIIMADEPTGALDSNTGKQVMDTLKELSKSKLIIVVSHDREFAEQYGDRIIELKDGRILQDVTKKELAAQETTSGIKVIDNDIVYIKKGQEISESEMKVIANIIHHKSKESDAFISFNGPANEKLKEGAKINDSGNKEKFVDTEKEDIKIKQYNPKSLKLIRSRLGFLDSFKMGASALKNKVGKLVFTIFLSFLAFTVFGVFDALSCWNRTESVYDAMRINKSKSVILLKQGFDTEDNEYDTEITKENDLKMLQEKFKERTIKGVVGEGSINRIRLGQNNEYNCEDSGGDPLYSDSINGYLNFSKTDVENFGFEMYKGRLPSAADEIAITKYTMETLIHSTSSREKNEEKITESNIIPKDENSENYFYVNLNGFGELGSSNGSGFAKIVGVIDNKVDYSKYKNMSSKERVDGLSKSLIEAFFATNFTRMAFVSEERYNHIAKAGVDTYVSFRTENSSWSMNKAYLYSLEKYLEYNNLNKDGETYKYYSYSVGGVHYRLYNTIGSYWSIEKVTYGTNQTAITVYKYNQDTNVLWNADNEEVTDRTEFIAQFGELNSDKIPSKFTEGYYSRDVVVEEDIIYYKGGSLINDQGKFVDIGENNIILEKDMADKLMGIEYEKAIAEGVTIDVEIGNTKLTFNVVGVSEEYNYFSDKTLNESILSEFQGYVYIVSTMTGNDELDKEFIYFCENTDDGVRWAVQNTTTGVLDMLEEIILQVARIFFYIAIGFAVFASLMLMNFISTSISYKKREIGVLRALGARGGDVFGIFFNESMIIAMINFVLSSIATVIACVVINTVLVTELGMEITLLLVGVRQIILILGVSVLSAFLGSFLPTFKISRKRPIDAINNR